MPAWLLSLAGPLLKGLFGWISGDHKESLKQRAVKAEAERESIRRAARDEQRIATAIRAGRRITSAAEWQKAIENPWHYG